MPNSTNIELTLHIHHPKSLFWTLGKTLSGFRGIHCFNMFQHVTKLRPNRGNAQHPSNKGNNSPQITNKKQICQRETPQNISKAYQLSDKTHPCIFFLCFLFEDWCPASALKRYASQFKKCCNGADLKGCRTSTTPSAAVSLDTSHHITSPWHDATSLRQDSRAFSKWLPDPAESAQLILRYTPHHSWIVVTTRGIAKICQYPAKSHQAKPISNLQKLSSLLEIWETAGESTRMSGPNFSLWSNVRWCDVQQTGAEHAMYPVWSSSPRAATPKWLQKSLRFCNLASQLCRRPKWDDIMKFKLWKNWVFCLRSTEAANYANFINIPTSYVLCNGTWHWTSPKPAVLEEFNTLDATQKWDFMRFTLW